MPGGGTAPGKSRTPPPHHPGPARHALARLVNTNVAEVPQIFCPYKEVLELYRLAPDIPADITLVWPDDNYGYIREFSDARERARRRRRGRVLSPVVLGPAARLSVAVHHAAGAHRRGDVQGL